MKIARAVALGLALLSASLALATGDSSEDPRLSDLRALLDANEDRAAYDQAVALRRKIAADSLNEARVLDVMVRAMRRLGQETDPQTLELAQRSLELKQQFLPADHVELASSHFFLGILLKNRKRYDEALEHYERALRLREAALGRDHPDVATSLLGLANLHKSRRDYDQSLSLYDRALAVRVRLLGNGHEDVASVLMNRGNLLRRMKRSGEALDSHRRAMEIYVATLGADDVRVAMSHFNVARLYEDLGDDDQALFHHREALAIRKGALEPGHVAVASSHHELGELLLSVGAHTEAIEHLREAVRIRADGLGEAKRATLDSRDRLGDALRRAGHLDGARRQFDVALKARRDTLDPQHRDLARSYRNLGNLHLDLGDWSEAVRWFEQALSVRRAQKRRNARLEGEEMNNLATALAELGRFDEAVQLHHQVIALHEQVLGSDHRDVAIDRSNLATLLLYRGDVAQAEALATEAAGKLSAQPDVDRPALRTATLVLANALVAQGRLEEARPHYRTAVRLSEESYGPEHPDVAYALELLAACDASLGHRIEAFEAAVRSEQLTRDHLLLCAQTLPEREALRYRAEGYVGLRLLVDLTAGGATIPQLEQVYDALVRSRAMILDEVARRRASLDPQDSQLQELWSQCQRARERLSFALVRGADRPQLDALRRQREEAERALASRGSRRRSPWEGVGLEDVRAALQPADRVISFALGDGDVSDPASPQQYVAFVLGKDSIDAVPLGNASELDAAVSRWHASVAEAPFDLAAAHERTRRYGGQLRQRLWDPLRPFLQQAERVFIVPEGGLHLVNFAALPDETGQGFLVEHSAIFHVLTTERDLTSRPAAAEGEAGLLAVGGVDFALPPSPREEEDCADLTELVFEPLPATAEEVRSVASLWPGPVTLLTGSEADENALLDRAEGQRVLHLATHGFFLDGGCRQRRAGARGVGRLVRSSEEAAAGGADSDNPLLLAGLALAGANRRQLASGAREDGVLLAEEIAGLDLEGIEWAVLSACDTGAGRLEAGEGVLGLRRAFQAAGARTVISSLWAVDDEPARRWMERLYQARFGEDRTTAESVRLASLRTLEARRQRGASTHPFYWAGFVAAGDPR